MSTGVTVAGGAERFVNMAGTVTAVALRDAGHGTAHTAPRTGRHARLFGSISGGPWSWLTRSTLWGAKNSVHAAGEGDLQAKTEVRSDMLASRLRRRQQANDAEKLRG